MRVEPTVENIRYEEVDESIEEVRIGDEINTLKKSIESENL
jgi:hypothetical protein